MQPQPITTRMIARQLGGFSNDNDAPRLPAGWVARIVRAVQKDEHGYLCKATEAQRMKAAFDDNLDVQAAAWAADTAIAIVKKHKPKTLPTLTEMMEAAQILAQYYWFEYGIPQPQVG